MPTRILFVDDDPHVLAGHVRPGDSGQARVTALATVHVANAVAHERRPGLPAGLDLAADELYLAGTGRRDDLPSWRACLDAACCETSHA
jgi:hypothetical protein